MPKAAVRHDPQGELSHELPAAFQNSQEASSTITAGGEHSLPLHFKNPSSNCLPNNKDPRLKRQRCLNKNHAQPQYPQPPPSKPVKVKVLILRQVTHATERRHEYAKNGRIGHERNSSQPLSPSGPRSDLRQAAGRCNSTSGHFGPWNGSGCDEFRS